MTLPSDSIPLHFVNPQHLAKPSGFSHGVMVPANRQLLFIAGQVGWDRHEQFASLGFLEQARQALINLVEVVQAAGGNASDIVRMTWYILDKRDYLTHRAELGGIYREIIGRHFPAMTLVEVKSLLEPQAVLEIEATAAIAPR